MYEIENNRQKAESKKIQQMIEDEAKNDRENEKKLKKRKEFKSKHRREYNHDKMLRELEIKTKKEVKKILNQVQTKKSVSKRFHEEQKKRIGIYMIDPRKKDNVLTMKKLRSMPTIDFESFKSFKQPSLLDPKLKERLEQEGLKLQKSPKSIKSPKKGVQQFKFPKPTEIIKLKGTAT